MLEPSLILKVLNDYMKKTDRSSFTKIKQILQVIYNKPGLFLTYLNYSSYYNFKKDEALFKRQKCILFNQFEKAASWRDIERKYRGKLEMLNDPKLCVKSKFFIEDTYLIFCFHRENDYNKQIIELIEYLHS